MGGEPLADWFVWEDDGIQFEDPDYRGGANTASLREAREHYRQAGVCEAPLRPTSVSRCPTSVRKPSAGRPLP